MDDLGPIHFTVGAGQKILLKAETDVAGHPSPTALIYEMLQILQIVRPYLRLLAEAMQTPHAATPSADGRHAKDLARIDERWVADLVPVGLVDERVVDAPAVTLPGDAP